MKFPKLLLLLLGFTAAAAEVPMFKELPTPKPPDHRVVNPGDFKIDHARLAARTEGLIYGDREGLLRLARFYSDTADGKSYFEAMQKRAADTVNNWYFIKSGFERHVYWFFQVEGLSLTYVLTGHPLLGKFLHDQIMQTARLPQEFWLHAELRKYKPERPHGMIETGQIAWKLSAAMSACGDLFTPEETAEVKQALREKGVVPMVNYLTDTKSVNNFIAIVGVGVFVTGKYLGDDEARELGKSALLRFVNGSVEEDGSYGEGTGYFAYPMDNLVPPVAAMTPGERLEFFKKSGLRNSPDWLAYPYLYASKGDKLLRTVYGDNAYSGRPSQSLIAMLADIEGNGLAAWLGARFAAYPDSWQCADWRWALVHLSQKEKTKAVSPEAAKLPRVRGFDNGENFIRSDWNDDGIVLSLYTAGLTRVGYAHQRPERHSINLGAYSEYFIVSPHSASYRSPIHYNYDLSTLSANTIRIDGMDQLFPMKGAGWGNKLPAYAVYGRPVAKLLAAEEGKYLDRLTGDARGCYREKPELAERTVLFQRNAKYFVVIDRLKVKKGEHTFTALWHFNNRDGKLALKGEEGENLLISRPFADLAMFTAASCELERKMTDGYMHGIRRDYSPGGENEGKPGSARVLNVSNRAKTGEMLLVTVLQPLRKGAKPLAAAWKDGVLTVGGDRFTIEKESIRFRGKDGEETYSLRYREGATP